MTIVDDVSTKVIASVKQNLARLKKTDPDLEGHSIHWGEEKEFLNDIDLRIINLVEVTVADHIPIGTKASLEWCLAMLNTEPQLLLEKGIDTRHNGFVSGLADHLRHSVQDQTRQPIRAIASELGFDLKKEFEFPADGHAWSH